jgi:hypothetical protein
MLKIRNISDHTIAILIKGDTVRLSPAHFLEVIDRNVIQNFSEIRDCVVVGQDLSEVCGPSFKERQ